MVRGKEVASPCIVLPPEPDDLPLDQMFIVIFKSSVGIAVPLMDQPAVAIISQFIITFKNGCKRQSMGLPFNST
jgi:hypothetical protein